MKTSLLPVAALSLALPLAAFGLHQKGTAQTDLIPGGLDQALESIQAEKIKTDLEFLASDEMGGRDTPSPELKIAARYIRDRLKKLGMTPGFKDQYLWAYSPSLWAVDAEATSMTIHNGESDFKLTFGTDYYMSQSSPSTRAVNAAGVIFMGEGKKADKVKADLEGHWALVEGGRRPSRKVQRDLFGRGAVGILILPDKSAKKTVAEAQNQYQSRMVKPRWSNVPETNKPGMLYLTEDSAKHFEGMPKKKGKALGCQVSESCKADALEVELENVIGIWPGSDPVLRNEVIIISAHYDHVGKRDNGDIYNGADDNGSGTVGLLAISEALVNYGPLRRTVMVQWVSGEEKGLKGSEAWTKDPWFPEGMAAVCNINIDMIGRNKGDELLITPTKSHDEYSWLTKVAEKHRSKEGFKKLGSADDYYWRSDHANYRKYLDVPVIFFFADVHEDYHKKTDTVEKINYDKIERVSRLVVRVLDALQEDKLGD